MLACAIVPSKVASAHPCRWGIHPALIARGTAAAEHEGSPAYYAVHVQAQPQFLTLYVNLRHMPIEQKLVGHIKHHAILGSNTAEIGSSDRLGGL